MKDKRIFYKLNQINNNNKSNAIAQSLTKFVIVLKNYKSRSNFQILVLNLIILITIIFLYFSSNLLNDF